MHNYFQPDNTKLPIQQSNLLLSRVLQALRAWPEIPS